MNCHDQESFGRSFETNSPSNLPTHPASTPQMSFLMSVPELHNTQFFSYLLKSKALCMKGCLAEQGFQCFALGTIWAASIMCTLSQKKTYQKTPKQHSYILLKNKLLNILCSILKMCFTRPLSCKKPLKLSRDEDCLLFILRMFNVKLTKLPRSVRAPDPPKASVIWVSISISLQKVPPWICSFLPSFWLYRKIAPHRSVKFTEHGPQL